MFKSKHSGWTWDLKRTPFGGGGGSWNPVTAVTDFVSSPIQSIENVVSGAGNAVGSGINAIGDAVAPVLEPIYQPIGSGAEQAGQKLKDTANAAVSSTKGWDPHITEGTDDWMAENGWMIPLAMLSYGAGSALGAGAAAGEAGAAGAAAGEAGAAAGAGAGAGAAAGADAAFIAADAASLSAQGLSQAAIAQNLAASYGLSEAAASSFALSSTAASEAFNSAIASGASSAEAQAAADATLNSYLQTAGQYASAGGETSNLTSEMIAYANASPDPIGSINAIAGMTPEEFASYTQVIGGAGNSAGFTAGEDLAQLMESYPDLSQAQLEQILQINYGTDPLLSADAANLAAQGYDAATIDQVLGYSYSPTELAGTGIESNALDSAGSASLSDTLKNINRARQLGKLLGQDAGKVSYKMPSSQDWLKNAQTLALNQPAQQQFGGLYESNKNPFTFQNPIANALAGGNKQPGVYDVSGTQGTTLNTAQQNKIFSSLLRS